MPRRNLQSYGELSSVAYVSTRKCETIYCAFLVCSLFGKQVATPLKRETFHIFFDGLYGTFRQWQLSLSCCSPYAKVNRCLDDSFCLQGTLDSLTTHKSQISEILFMMFHFFFLEVLLFASTHRYFSQWKICAWQWTCSICNGQPHGIHNFAYRMLFLWRLSYMSIWSWRSVAAANSNEHSHLTVFSRRKTPSN